MWKYLYKKTDYIIINLLYSDLSWMESISMYWAITQFFESLCEENTFTFESYASENLIKSFIENFRILLNKKYIFEKFTYIEICFIVLTFHFCKDLIC